ncbi:MAG: hypothetical protein IJI03_17160 [Rudaea sp.]|uniref:hypothetical protein n=2 Tax=unclassified Rudaea TaxID=2627037 RepID=UPI0010FA2801|nr:hypothetical protein [Rudaea sp. 3F27F6]MBR0346980.1 hypothetical protein [Rudaea sp.]
MSIREIREAIVARMSAIPDIGVVQKFERYAKDEATLKKFYYSPAHGNLRGWYVRRLATSESGNRQASSVEVCTWRIRGYMSLSDAAETELVFDDLIEGVRDAFVPDESLGGLVDQCSDPTNIDGVSGIQLIDAGPVMFGGVLCHSARLELLTVRFLDRSP